MEFFMYLFGFKRCPCCRRYSRTVKRRRRNTAYVDDHLNYLRACYMCYEEDYDYYQDLWNAYYSGR